MDVAERIRAEFPALETEENFSFARHTTIGCGGTARISLSPASAEEAARLLGFLDRTGIPYRFLGAGANVLPADGVFEGAVVRFNRMDRIRAEGETLFAQAGCTIGALLRAMRSLGLGGAEFMTGIPATVGGAAAMNAGVAEGKFGDLVRSVTCAVNGALRVFSREACGFGVKTSVFQSGIAVLEVKLKAESLSERESEERLAFFRNKRASLPKGRSMGCVFVNPAGIAAGRVIEECGLKGKRIGGAVVSCVHANFILNEGGTSADVAALVSFVKRTVYDRKGILLREEIKRIP